jgi:ABC-type glycerol-3-phosphate transport system substrate-binding protein
MRQWSVLRRLLFTALGALVPAVSSARVTIDYWEKWTRFEGEAMKAVVDDFNASQDRVFVNMVTVSQIEQKALMAVAGGDPPDVTGLYDYNLVSYADKNALIPLDDRLAKAGIGRKDFIPAFWDICTYQGRMWAMPTTPATCALHWNKRMFRRAGLDPNRPPKTIEELDRMAEKLVLRDANGSIVQMGFLPPEPGWWNWAWPHFFGGRLWDGGANITCDAPENIKALAWVQSYSRRYGLGPTQVFRSGFGNFASPQNAFLAGKVAMVIQGVWMYNFIKEFAPKLEWGAAPFPTADPEKYGMANAGLDIIAIPRGSRHPDEAFEFIRFVMSPRGMERLCMGQRKFSPLRKVSAGFAKRHPHPYISLFRDMSFNKGTFSIPQLTFWQEYNDELNVAFDRIWLNQASPERAMADVKRKMQKKLDRRIKRGLNP